MTAADSLAEFQTTVAEIMELLSAHRLHTWVPGLSDLGARAEQEPGRSADHTLAELENAYRRFVAIPDGFSAVYVQDGTGVDRVATQRLDVLRDRLAAILRGGQVAS